MSSSTEWYRAQSAEKRKQISARAARTNRARYLAAKERGECVCGDPLQRKPSGGLYSKCKECRKLYREQTR